MLRDGRIWEGGFFMAGTRHSAEQIIGKLREAEVSERVIQAMRETLERPIEYEGRRFAGGLDPLIFRGLCAEHGVDATAFRLGDDAAATLRPHLVEALEAAPEVLLLTHVPPFREACWHEGRTSDDDWAPGFTCKAVGDLLLGQVDRIKIRTAWASDFITDGSFQPAEAKIEAGFVFDKRVSIFQF